jgi:AcrR family transcriptional regulator
MGRRRQVSDREISVAAREVFLDRGPKAPVAMVAKKLGVSTATLFQRTGSKQQLMLMAFQPEGTAVTAPSSRPRSRCARPASSRTYPNPRRRSCARGSPRG